MIKPSEQETQKRRGQANSYWASTVCQAPGAQDKKPGVPEGLSGSHRQEWDKWSRRKAPAGVRRQSWAQGLTLVSILGSQPYPTLLRLTAPSSALTTTPLPHPQPPKVVKPET